MRLSSSTGDFSFYVDSIPEKISCFKETKFKYINLEQTGNVPFLFSENDDDWMRFANECGEAAEKAGVKFAVSHAPCLHKVVHAAFKDKENEEYRANVRAIRNSIKVCNRLGISRTVIHACADKSLTPELFFRYNEAFYREFFDLAEDYGITLMTENWDDDAYLFSNGKQLREFVDRIDHPLLAVCWDTAHGNIAKSSREMGQYENIVAIGDKLKGLHVSDNFGDCHHHSWPFAGIINFDEIMQGITDVKYDGYFNFEASYTLLHSRNIPYNRRPFEHNGETVRTLLNPTTELKKKAVDLLYEIGAHILKTYDCYEE